MIKYLGSKRVLIPTILEVVARVGAPGGVCGPRGARTVLDLFSGTARVGHALKGAGFCVHANDHNAYAHTLAMCYVQADRENVLQSAERIIRECNALPGRPGYFTATFCEQSRYVQPRNGEKIDAIRGHIEALGLEPELRSVVLTSLVEAADRVDSTTGLQMAYLKAWSARSHNELEMRVPAVLTRAHHGKGTTHQLDALEAARTIEADIAYLDPPYNQHSYLGNYHVWESLVRWDKPGVYGVACKRVDVRTRRSAFNSRAACEGALRAVLEAVRARALIVSFSDEGFIPRGDMEALLANFGRVTTIELPSKRYVGARIGIYNPKGEKVGKVGHLTNTEFVFVVERGDGKL